MKNRFSCKLMMVLGVTVLCSQMGPVLRAQNLSPAPASAVAAAPASASEPTPVQLSPGVPDILKLVRAHVGDETITAFIRYSGRTYHLSVSDILYMRKQGVSEQVLIAMLSTGQNVAATAAQAAPQPAPTGPTADWVNSNPQPAPAYVEPAPVYTQPSPVYDYPAPDYGYYDYWPYYYGGYPAISFGFGYGGRYYGGYRGGYYGGGFRGGSGGFRGGSGGFRGGGGGFHGGGGGFHGGGGGHR